MIIPIQNSQTFKVGDLVHVLDPQFAIERYAITEVIGKGDIEMYAVKGVGTGEVFSYFTSDELKKI